MEIITTHHITDLDGIASLILASKLHPKGKIVLPTTLGNSVKKLISLFKNILNFYSLNDIDLKNVTNLILVDTSGPNRINPFDKIIDHVKLTIYDHHPLNSQNIKYRTKDVSNSYGSNTSYLLDICLKKIKNFNLKQHELDICLLGIYEDTGNFLFPTTKFKDFQMTGYLVEHGANLNIIKEFINIPLDSNQKNTLNLLLNNSTYFYLGNETIIFSTLSSEKFIGGISELIDEILKIKNASGVFIITESKGKISIVGRSTSDNLPLDKILGIFGGGGYPNAYSTTFKGQTIDQAMKAIKHQINTLINFEKKAEDIMSSPVKAIFSNLSLKEANILSERTGHSGFPVVENDRLVGLISKKEISRLVNHGMGKLPVSKYMNKNLIIAFKDTPLSKLKELFIENNIGRIPILHKDTLIGIITRTDLLNALYDNYSYSKIGTQYLPEILNKNFINFFPTTLKEIFKIIKKISLIQNQNAYLIGGIVRDLLLGVPNEDIDIVVSKDAYTFAQEFSKFFQVEKIVSHEKFKTATVFLKNSYSIDIATLRSEYYQYPTALPTVEEGTIRDDLFRRDFTINALAIDIGNKNFGKIIDYFKGYEDIENKLIRIIHKVSFIDDPTRIIRACRFASRYDFTIEKDTHNLIIDAIEMGLLSRLSWNRLKSEFQHILNDKNPAKGIKLLNKYSLLQLIHENIFLDNSLQKKLNLCNKVKNSLKLNINFWLLFLLVLTSQLTSQELNIVFLKFGYQKSFSNNYSIGIYQREEILKNLENCSLPSDIYELLNKYPDETIILLGLESSSSNKRKIKSYLFKLKRKIAIIKGEDLIKLGLLPGPDFKGYLQKAFSIQLNMKKPTRDSILKEMKLL